MKGVRGFQAARGGRRAGFTFVEVLAALLFLAAVVPTIVAALSLSSRASEIAERGGIAAQLAENKLNEMLLADAWQTAQATSGDCSTDFPNFRWQLTQTPWATDSASNMTELKVEVFYKVQGREVAATVNTLVNTLTASSTTSGSGAKTSTSTTGGTSSSQR